MANVHSLILTDGWPYWLVKAFRLASASCCASRARRRSASAFSFFACCSRAAESAKASPSSTESMLYGYKLGGLRVDMVICMDASLSS